eukprot:GHVU01181176.1.p2 GENE.GHVU01181176.1~~GHVU01181176.1.p2  ORF type:complete len:107 (+),score=12.41 GHVU01181176.1:941-1261(+)
MIANKFKGTGVTVNPKSTGKDDTEDLVKGTNDQPADLPVEEQTSKVDTKPKEPDTPATQPVTAPITTIRRPADYDATKGSPSATQKVQLDLAKLRTSLRAVSERHE